MMIKKFFCSYKILILIISFMLLLFHNPAYNFDRDLKPEDIVAEIGYVPLTDGVRLAYSLYLPAKEGKFPVVLEYNPYWASGQFLNLTVMDFLNNGYAVLGVNFRGTGCSEGNIDLFLEFEREGKDGAEVIEWAAKQPWCTGSVGMFGNSYSGIIQFVVAALHPKGLKALSAGGLSSDIYSEVTYPGGILNVQEAWWTYWAQPFVAEMGLKRRMEIAEDPDCQKRWRQRPSRSWQKYVRHPLRDEYWKERAPEIFAAQVVTPALMIQGWQDEEVPARGAVRLYECVQGPKKMIISNGGHGVYSGTWPRMGAETIRWFDRWLKGIPNGIDREPPITIWFETQFPTRGSEKEEVKPAWIEHFSDWPVPETEQVPLYLNRDKKLSKTVPQGESETGKLTYFYPYSTELIFTNQTFDVAPPPLGALHYQTVPLERDVGIAGTVVLTLYLSSEVEDTDIMAVLYDIDPEGNTLYIQRGFMRASHRHIDKTRTRSHDPYFSHDKEDLLEPGKVYEVKVPLYPVAHVFRQGHQVQIGIMTPPTIPLPNWGFIIKNLPGIITVHHSEEYPSTLTLPVIPGLKAKASPPALGALPFQPYRKAKEPNPWQLPK